jgi:hypothetical protein
MDERHELMYKPITTTASTADEPITSSPSQKTRYVSVTTSETST